MPRQIQLPWQPPVRARVRGGAVNSNYNSYSDIAAGLTGQANGGGVLQSVLLQAPDHHLSRGGDVGPGGVRHADLQAVRARGGPLPDAELTRALVQTEQPETQRETLNLLFIFSAFFSC